MMDECVRLLDELTDFVQVNTQFHMHIKLSKRVKKILIIVCRISEMCMCVSCAVIFPRFLGITVNNQPSNIR